MKPVVTSTLILLLGSTSLVGCSTLSKHVATNHVNINAAGNLSNSAVDSRGSGTDRTTSNITVSTSKQATSNVPTPTTNSTGVHTDDQKSSPTNQSPTSKSSSTASSKHSTTVSTTTNSNGHRNSTTGKQPNQSSSTSSTKTNSTISTTNGSNPPSTSALPSKIAATWTNKFNSMYVNRNYTGPSSSSFDDLVEEMAQGKITPDAVKQKIFAMQPWDATWTAANNGDGKTYQFVVHDVGAFTYQTSVLNDDVTSQQWRAHAQQVLDDSFYTKWNVHWYRSTKTYTVAFLDVGFYLNSTN